MSSAAAAEAEAVPGVSDRLVGAVKASLATSMLWMLRQYMYRAYRLNDERVAAFAGAMSKKNEAKLVASKAS
jgi:hypothetical protein